MKKKMLIIFLLLIFMTGCDDYEINSDKNAVNYEVNQENNNISSSNDERVYTHEDILELLSEKLKLRIDDYEYQGEDYLGGYTYTYIMKEGDVGNPMTYVVDPLSGNVYDEVNEKGIINLFNENEYIDEKVILENIQKNYCDSDLKVIEDGYYAGNVSILIYKSTDEKKFNEVRRLVVNPFTLEVMNYETNEVIGNLYDKQVDKISD